MFTVLSEIFLTYMYLLYTKRINIISSLGVLVSDDKSKWTMISIRITDDLLASIERAKSPRLCVSRNFWIIEAIQEKLKREEKRG